MLSELREREIYLSNSNGRVKIDNAFQGIYCAFNEVLHTTLKIETLRDIRREI